VTRPRFGAWRFVHPDFDASEGAPGLRTGARGNIEMVADSRSVRQAILLLLSTRPGERVMRPELGCELHQLLFGVNDDTTAGLAMHYVRRAIVRWEPRVEILRLDARRDPADPSRLDLVLDYRIRRTAAEDRLVYRIEWMPQEA
jgi:hypothetical protein